MNKKEIAEKVFKSTMDKIVESRKEEIVDVITRSEAQGETEESLAQKAILVKKYMDNGMSFGDACDQKDVYIGREDADYMYSRYIYKSHDLSYQEWYMIRVERKIREMIIIQTN